MLALFRIHYFYFVYEIIKTIDFDTSAHKRMLILSVIYKHALSIWGGWLPIT
jgi:hypothetical protein